MAIEQTLILCKPDAVARGLVGEIVARFERRGYTLAAMKLMTADRARAEEHYGEHKGKPFFAGVVEYITSAPIVAMVIDDRRDQSHQSAAGLHSRRLRADDRA